VAHGAKPLVQQSLGARLQRSKHRWEGWIVKPQGLNKRSQLELDVGVHLPGGSPGGAISGNGQATWVAKPFWRNLNLSEAWMF
jgi:hypothetical protein